MTSLAVAKDLHLFLLVIAFLPYLAHPQIHAKSFHPYKEDVLGSCCDMPNCRTVRKIYVPSSFPSAITMKS